MSRLYINQTLESSIREYCEMNDIEDVNAFANRCASKGLNIIKFGENPIDNIKREREGITDFEKPKRKKNEKAQVVDVKKPSNIAASEDISRTSEIKEEQSSVGVTEEIKQEGFERKEEEVKPLITKRKIQIIKKK